MATPNDSARKDAHVQDFGARRLQFDSLYQRQLGALIGSLRRIVGCAHTAEDLAQDAYLRVSDALEQRREVSHLQPFLYQTARNLALDHLRRESIRQAPADAEEAVARIACESPTPERSALLAERVERLRGAMRELPERRRQVLVLHRLHGWRHSQIAAHLGISVSAVEKNLRLALAHCLQAQDDDGVFLD